MTACQRVGAVAALIEAMTYVVGAALILTVLAPAFTGHLEPGAQLAFLIDNRAVTRISNLFIYVAGGVSLAVLAVALHRRLKPGSPAIVQTATAFGLIWAGVIIAAGMVFNIGLGTAVDLYAKDPAQAVTVWLAIDTVHRGLESGNVILGGLWTLLVSCAAWRSGELSPALNYLGVIIGAAGLLTLVPALETVVFVFGLGGIVWFVWLAIVMWRSDTSPAA